VLGADADEVAAGVDLHGARAVVCEDWAEGQSASLRTGLDAAGDAQAVVITLGDQPHIAARAIAAVIAARGDGAQAVRATYDGTASHPTLIERELFPALHQLTGDEGARAVLQGARVTEVPCDGLGGPDDVDTREQLGR
jgi:CTP:molybdopterin cytidylyltransferase MocA